MTAHPIKPTTARLPALLLVPSLSLLTLFAACAGSSVTSRDISLVCAAACADHPLWHAGCARHEEALRDYAIDIGCVPEMEARFACLQREAKGVTCTEVPSGACDHESDDFQQCTVERDPANACDLAIQHIMLCQGAWVPSRQGLCFDDYKCTSTCFLGATCDEILSRTQDIAKVGKLNRCLDECLAELRD